MDRTGCRRGLGRNDRVNAMQERAIGAAPPLRILIVDDDELVRMTLVAMLAPSGHSVVESGDGRKAARMLEADGADLLVVDIFMPEQDGLELIQEARSRAPHMRILAISGGGDGLDYLTFARKLGADATLTKPFHKEQLVAAVVALTADRPAPPPR